MVKFTERELLVSYATNDGSYGKSRNRRSTARRWHATCDRRSERSTTNTRNGPIKNTFFGGPAMKRFLVHFSTGFVFSFKRCLIVDTSTADSVHSSAAAMGSICFAVGVFPAGGIFLYM
jgi:hypothetical protein